MWLHHYSATAHVTAYANPKPNSNPDPKPNCNPNPDPKPNSCRNPKPKPNYNINPDPKPNCIPSICRTYSYNHATVRLIHVTVT